ncbi:MAG: nucleotide exchange factor GrpE [Pseudomonadales bacterium]|jgi:molecular chaperone GrpE|nr:nucleotide exchange factor GrpE [Pseudomonadales bacterium]MDP4766585.1 nucleotide exchange factor GrpE [Pseudomonadales bacterium]MDP4876267.1 nucleotide exchange factor GrpE [Pseudomonadales bacterium]MDP4910277.1 nucleotide exchange factor GrpE [Pseudomonadales bacterium]MDP5059897.1 nucleotide exchange factor GrpE [Pseudomonadales bacterium]
MTSSEEQKDTQSDAGESADSGHHQELTIEQAAAAVAAAQSDAPAAVALDDLSVEELRAQTAQAIQDADKFRDAALRAEAEMQNVRRRAEREVEHAVKYGVEKILQNLLPVMDSLEKAIESAEQAGADTEATQAIIEGMGLCQRLFLDVLTKEGVAVVDPHGEPFNPNLHQAISMVENAEVEPNSVVAVVQKGYQLNSRLVRPAMVMVAKSTNRSIDQKV